MVELAYPELGLSVNLEVSPGRNRSSASMQFMAIDACERAGLLHSPELVGYPPPPQATLATAPQGLEENPACAP